MTTFTERRTWAVVPANEFGAEAHEDRVEQSSRKLQSETYAGPITLTQYHSGSSMSAMRWPVSASNLSLPSATDVALAAPVASGTLNWVSGTGVPSASQPDRTAATDGRCPDRDA
ncbi:MAG: hypothetical protein R3C69_11430 [Geminicoccaceae bacterium]